MGKIDIKEKAIEVKTELTNEKIEEVETAEKTAKPVESVDKSTEEPKAISKAESKTEPKKIVAVLVEYLGGGIWKDSVGAYWSKKEVSEEVEASRQYSAEEYEKRNDLKFMVQYGEMKATEVKM